MTQGVESAKAFLELPYAARKLIVVLSDLEARVAAGAAIRGGGFAAPEGVYAGSEGTVLGAALGVAPIALSPGEPVSIIGPLLRVLGKWVTWILRRIQGDQSRALQATAVSELVAQHFTFPVSGLSRNHLYAGHPHLPGVYYPFASFHTQVFEQKANEAKNLLVSLGASDLSLTIDDGFSSEVAVSMGFMPILDAEAFRTRSGSASWKATVKLPGHGKPRVPETMAWYDSEPNWQSIASNRIEHGTLEDTLEARYREDFGVTAAIAKTATTENIQIGGKFERFHVTRWTIRVTYPPLG